MSPRRDTPQPKNKPRKSLPDELARDAVAHEKTAPGDRVEMVLRVRLRKPVAEALTAWAVREETNPASVGTTIYQLGQRELLAAYTLIRALNAGDVRHVHWSELRMESRL